MSRSSLLWALALLASALAVIAPGEAGAQACCAGGGAYLPARLKLHEDELVAVQARADDDLGSLDPTGKWVGNPGGASELDLEEDVLVAFRVLGRGQVELDIPYVETRRTASGLNELGGGLGDISLAFRYDFIYPAESLHLPGLALSGGVTAPTGVPPEQAKTPLLVDATGTGAWQGLVGGEVEEVVGNWIATADVLLSVSAPRNVGLVHEQLGPQITAFAAAGYLLPREAALALVLSTTQSFNATINGAGVPASGRGLTTVSLAGGLPLTSTWRLQASLNYDLPVLGRNHPAGTGATFTVVRAWL